MYEFYPIERPVFRIDLDKHFEIKPICIVIGKRYFYYNINFDTYEEYEAPARLDMEIL